MGFLDDVKAAATEAAIKVKETAEELQAKRELGQAHGELGQKTFELIESGEVSSPVLEPLAERIRTLNAQLETTAPEAAEATEATEAVGVTATNGDGEPPATPTV
jgi:hypothetical protein